MEKSNDLLSRRHSLAHLLGAAILELYPEAKLAIGPAIDDGFYYDVALPAPLSDKDLPKLEKKMRQLLQRWDAFTSREVTAAEARTLYQGNPYKLELIDEIEAKGEPITLYTAGEFTQHQSDGAGFTDLCRGGHVESMREISPKSFALDRLAGAYWRGSEANDMLTRIYGLAFASPDELAAYRTQREAARARDHKKLGPALGLFMFHETAPGMPYWLPKGVVLYNELVAFWRREHAARGYQEIVSPLLNKKELYVTSGHYEHYWPDMFTVKTKEGEEYGIKAMNCPNAMVVFGSAVRSYKDLPLRLSDTDTLHRHERSGTLNGLLRVREFRQDDAHVFVTEEQIGGEYQEIFAIVERFYSIFNMAYSFRLGTRPDSFMGDPATWDRAEATLTTILKQSGKPYTIAAGDGAFYGPKVDIIMQDALNREWQMGTVQLDFQQPRRFALAYTDAHGQKQTPVAIHRVVLGSLERFIGILIEHYAGAFPLWLAPVQVRLLPISDSHAAYAQQVAQTLREHDIRAEVDEQSDTLGKKLRAGKLAKIPYLLVIGDKEVAGQTVSVESRDRGSQGQVAVATLAQQLAAESVNKQ